MEETAGSNSAECVSSNLHSRIVLEKKVMKKRLVTLEKERKAVELEWAVLQKDLLHVNVNDKDQ